METGYTKTAPVKRLEKRLAGTVDMAEVKSETMELVRMIIVNQSNLTIMNIYRYGKFEYHSQLTNTYLTTEQFFLSM